MTSVASSLNNPENTRSEQEIMDIDTAQTQTSQAGALGLAVPDQPEENWVSLKFIHSGKEYTVDLADSDRFVTVASVSHSDPLIDHCLI